ncbi:MAG: DUF4395 domain-containing protein [Chloroflexi bacterium]|uniref:DUF4395 domain-containing protein n=1 Tax=Candidatus Chlorohelix allophototropha TaxID=3003348 RepID=A0A8T7LUG5_9CHLR|nr:DUF4395 domain-containing protein [Chloroflexota bacterium]WJW66415.1 DUF4395 domain-containing protein [Chloroflexota bacterium L227-S17]
MAYTSKSITNDIRDIPQPVVTLNRATIVTGIVVGVAFQQPLFTTALFLILLFAVLFGPSTSVIYQVGIRVFAKQIPDAPREDRRLMRFNNSIAVILLGSAQVAFLTGNTIVGWVFALMVAVAATVALLGFCVGCFLYFQFKINRYKLFGR